jgi:hypothetical protein
VEAALMGGIGGMAQQGRSDGEDVASGDGSVGDIEDLLIWDE